MAVRGKEQARTILGTPSFEVCSMQTINRRAPVVPNVPVRAIGGYSRANDHVKVAV